LIGKNKHIIKNKLEKREGRIPNKETIKEIPVVCRDIKRTSDWNKRKFDIFYKNMFKKIIFY